MFECELEVTPKKKKRGVTNTESYKRNIIKQARIKDREYVNRQIKQYLLNVLDFHESM